MILYTCPHCQASGMYPADLGGETHCRTCGGAFALRPGHRVHPPAHIAVGRRIGAVWTRARTSTVPIYAAGALALFGFAWLVISIVGLVPDELRLVNRRFVAPDDWNRIRAATALLAVGEPRGLNEIEFAATATAFAISNDGFFLTAAHAVPPTADIATMIGYKPLVWIFLQKRRLQAEVVWRDTVADLLLVKVDHHVPYRYRLATDRRLQTLNVDVRTLGFQQMPVEVDSQVLDTELASTTGTVSRVFQDRIGTWWVEHTAPLKPGASGGPLLRHQRVVGVNVEHERGFTKAVETSQYATQLQREMERWRQEN